jgi:helicase required for RNAi-mediated heterochromatin assembly 1
MGKESKTQVFDAGSDWDDFDGDDDDREPKMGPISRPRAPTRTSTSADEDATRCAEGVRRWQAFAQGGALLDDYRRAGIVVGGERPQKDATPVKQNVVGPVEGTLIDFDDDDGQAQVLGAEDDQPAASAKGWMVTYDGARDCPAKAMTFGDHGPHPIGAKRPKEYLLPEPATDYDHLPGGWSSPAEGQLIELS